MKLNKKGFTLIEILATITILGILSGLAVNAVTKYKEKTIKESYYTMEDTIYDAAQAYIEKKGSIFTGTKTVSTQTLIDEGYLPVLYDPKNDDNTCSGEVLITRDKGTGTVLDKYTYIVKVNCHSYQSQRVTCMPVSSTCSDSCDVDSNKKVCNELSKKQNINECPSGQKKCIEAGAKFES